jgi:hypothetical protein
MDPLVRQAQLRAPAPPSAMRDDAATAYQIPFELPGPERLFRLESEDAFIQRLKQEARERKPEELVFPEKLVLSKDPYYGRDWPRMSMVVEPHYVCHGRLNFEELNAERYGWDMGVFQPLASVAYFYKDVALYPLHAMSQPFRCYECNKGKCLPGDPVPYLLYPPEITATGVAAEAGAIGALIAIFP